MERRSAGQLLAGALTNLGHCKLKLTINTNQVKCWFLRGNCSTRRKPLRAEQRTNKPTNQLAKELSEQKSYGSAFACIFCIFLTLPRWKQHIFRCTGLLSTLYGRNTSVLLSFILLKRKGKRKQTGRKYSTPPCNSVAAPGPPSDVKVGTPSKRSVTLSWKKPVRYGDDVQMYTVIYLIFLICCKQHTWDNHSRFSKARRASCNRCCCNISSRLVYRALCCKECQIMIGFYDLRLTIFITNFSQLSYIS